MNRDGALQSIWQTEPAYSVIASTHPESVYDVAIAGGGITGLTTALLLAEKGHKVVLCEAHTLGFGTTSGTTAHLNTLIDTPYTTIEKDFGKEAVSLIRLGTREAIETIRERSTRYGIDCDFKDLPGYLFAETEDEIDSVTDMIEGARLAGLDVSEVDAIPIPVSFVKAFRIEAQAQFHITQYLSGLAAAFEKMGGVILEKCPVTAVETVDNLVELKTGKGSLRAKKMVWATHIPPGINLLSLRVAPYLSYVVAAKLSNESQLPEALVYDGKDPYYYYRTQEIDGVNYLIAGGCDHKTGHEENTEAVFSQLEAYLRQFFAVKSIDYRWSAQYYEPVDGLPYIGQLPGSELEYCATGYSGNGMIFGTLSGIILSDLLAGKKSLYADLFQPSRLKPIAGFKDFIKENADVAKEFVKGHFSYEKLDELADLVPGEGRIVQYEGEKLAIYKAENGTLTALNPVCTHAGCIVNWNMAEKSWDCPCHGGRFATDGCVLTGPPKLPLKVLELSNITGKSED